MPHKDYQQITVSAEVELGEVGGLAVMTTKFHCVVTGQRVSLHPKGDTAEVTNHTPKIVAYCKAELQPDTPPDPAVVFAQCEELAAQLSETNFFQEEQDAQDYPPPTVEDIDILCALLASFHFSPIVRGFLN